ncbi:MAG: acetate/propionate family kinase [Burkholderiaceae bacterium]|jgi:acetate kinase|nr:acetate/propionate family kinase [Burkholderiales bacterium]MCZ8336618.1 acetate/propionate family kinase [Burkholderiaceae bacterium]
MADAIVVLNAGSSSLKFSLFAERDGVLDPVLSGQIERLLTAPRFVARDRDRRVVVERSWGEGVRLGHDGALGHLMGVLDDRLAGDRLLGVGHRVVHGGEAFAEPIRVDATVLAALRELEPLAPLHQPHNLAAIAAMLERVPGLPQVACFDTAFHRTVPDLAQMFGLPHAMHEAGIRRYGFHGLSYEHVASVLPGIDPRAAAGRTVVMHLGNGASLCAMHGGRSVATTMGFTAVDGLMMGTRTGTLDPGVVLYLMDERGMSAREVETMLYSQSGLLGVSGVSSDMRTLLASDAPGARLAIELYCYRIRRELGSMAAALGGLDAIVFTAGIGEHAAPIREAVCRDAAWLGVELDAAANAAGADRLHAAGSRVAVWRLPTDEEGVIARHTAALVLG